MSKAGANVKDGLSLKFTPWSKGEDAKAADGGTSPHTGIAVLDLDDDRDLDLVLGVDGDPPIAVLNDRLGRFHAEVAQGLWAPAWIIGLLSC